MKVRKQRGEDGREVRIFLPETEEDLALLERMEEVRKLDQRVSFGDDPQAAQEDTT